MGLPKASEAPSTNITESARATLLKAKEDCEEGEYIRLSISANFEHGLTFDQKNDSDFVIQHGEVSAIIDPYSATRAKDLLIDYVQENLDAGFVFSNPNEPPKVNELSVEELRFLRDQGRDPLLIDVRPKTEGETARISFAKSLGDLSEDEINNLKKDHMIVFHCHHGQRSRQAAESFRLKGFSNLYNLTGGIDAWSKQIDSSVPVY